MNHGVAIIINPWVILIKEGCVNIENGVPGLMENLEEVLVWRRL